MLSTPPTPPTTKPNILLSAFNGLFSTPPVGANNNHFIFGRPIPRYQIPTLENTILQKPIYYLPLTGQDLFHKELLKLFSAKAGDSFDPTGLQAGELLNSLVAAQVKALGALGPAVTTVLVNMMRQKGGMAVPLSVLLASVVLPLTAFGSAYFETFFKRLTGVQGMKMENNLAPFAATTTSIVNSILLASAKNARGAGLGVAVLVFGSAAAEFLVQQGVLQKPPGDPSSSPSPTLTQSAYARLVTASGNSIFPCIAAVYAAGGIPLPISSKALTAAMTGVMQLLRPLVAVQIARTAANSPPQAGSGGKV